MGDVFRKKTQGRGFIPSPPEISSLVSPHDASEKAVVDSIVTASQADGPALSSFFGDLRENHRDQMLLRFRGLPDVASTVERMLNPGRGGGSLLAYGQRAGSSQILGVFDYAVGPKDSFEFPEVAVVVHPEVENRGVAKSLFSKAVDTLKAEGRKGFVAYPNKEKGLENITAWLKQRGDLGFESFETKGGVKQRFTFR